MFKLYPRPSQIATVFRLFSGKMNRPKRILFFTLLIVLIVLPVGVALAVGAAYAFGYHGNEVIKGHRVYVWTDTPPNGEVWTAAPVGMCQLSPCGGKKIETGWIKGIAGDLGDTLQQYAAYTDIDGSWQQVFHLGNLNENTWYQFKIMYSDSASRWEAWRFNDVVWFAPHGLGWNRGKRLAAGSENNSDGGWMQVWGWNPEYRPDPGAWQLYNYSASQTLGGGHIDHAYDFGYHAWGP